MGPGKINSGSNINVGGCRSETSKVRAALSSSTRERAPLGWLKSRKDRNGRPLIADHQFEAGERLRADYWFAHLPQRVTANWSALAPSERSRRAAPSSAADFSDNALAAKQRVQHALRDVGPELAGVLVDVCCELKGLEEAEKEHGWPQRAGKVVLQIALTRLARHYGLIREQGSRPAASRRLRHWGSEELPADARCVARGRRSVSGLRGQRSTRVAPDPLDHGEEPVRALRGEMLLEVELVENGVGVEIENVIGASARVEGEQDGDQAAHDVSVTVADEGEVGFALRRRCGVVASQTWLTQPCTLLAALRASSGSGSSVAAELDDIAVAILPIVEQLEIGEDGIDASGRRALRSDGPGP